MKRTVKFNYLALLAMLTGIVALGGLGAKDPEPKKTEAPAAEKAEGVKPKPLSENVKKGLAYLVSQQHENGGWGQGGGWRTGGKGGGRIEGANVQDPPDVANTCIATLALLRAGNTAKEGEYSKNVVKALEFIFSKIEQADKESMYVTDVRNTQIQSKIGPYADTFLAALVLAELKGKMPDEKLEKRLIVALDKTMDKIERNQQADGTFAGNQGWATVLSQGLCSKAINRAAQAGARVKPETLARDQKLATAALEGRAGGATMPTAPLAGARLEPSVTGRPAVAMPARGGVAGGDDAGVALYSGSGRTAGLQEAVNTLRQAEKKNREILADPKAPKAAKDQARKELDRLGEAEKANEAAVKGLARRLEDRQFIAGFGNNGGEEFLSYMNISETLLAKGGEEWEKWDKQITANLNKIQDKDGGWSGHHCITGRTFCTSAALLVLMADRAPVPVAAKVKSGK